MAGPLLLIIATAAFDEQHLGQSSTTLCAEEVGFRKAERLIQIQRRGIAYGTDRDISNVRVR
jgi:hypothetical protein